jgi:site-specific recombinase XerD
MRTDTVSSLRQRMIEDMNARKLGSHTQRSHILSCKRFAAFLKRSPDTATAEDIRQFQLHLSQTSVSICNRNRIMTGLRFLFRVTLRRLDLAAEIYHIREPQKIPLVMSPDETRRLLAVADNLKVRTLLGLGYGCGLRAGEVVRLRVKHIDRAQKIIRVEQSKGRKDRNVMLSPETFDLLRQWWKVRPSRQDATTPLQERWLFPGRKPGKPMTTRQLSRLFHEAGSCSYHCVRSVRRQSASTRLMRLVPPASRLFEALFAEAVGLDPGERNTKIAREHRRIDLRLIAPVLEFDLRVERVRHKPSDGRQHAVLRLQLLAGDRPVSGHEDTVEVTPDNLAFGKSDPCSHLLHDFRLVQRLQLRLVPHQNNPPPRLERHRELTRRATRGLVHDDEIERRAGEPQGRAAESDTGAGHNLPRAGEKRLKAPLRRRCARHKVARNLARGAQPGRIGRIDAWLTFASLHKGADGFIDKGRNIALDTG